MNIYLKKIIYAYERLKTLDFCLNLELIHESDIPPLMILLSQCKLSSIYFHGNNPAKHETINQPLNKTKSFNIKKTMGLTTSSLNSNISSAEKNKKHRGIIIY